MTYEINKELVLSTGHIQRSTAQILDMGDSLTETLAESLVWERMEFGYRIYVPLADGPAYPTPVIEHCPELAALMLLAYTHGCKWLVLDSDGDQHPQLPMFDW